MPTEFIWFVANLRRFFSVVVGGWKVSSTQFFCQQQCYYFLFKKKKKTVLLLIIGPCYLRKINETMFGRLKPMTIEVVLRAAEYPVFKIVRCTWSNAWTGAIDYPKRLQVEGVMHLFTCPSNSNLRSVSGTWSSLVTGRSCLSHFEPQHKRLNRSEGSFNLWITYNYLSKYFRPCLFWDSRPNFFPLCTAPWNSLQLLLSFSISLHSLLQKNIPKSQTEHGHIWKTCVGVLTFVFYAHYPPPYDQL